jgi:hypothetical protein
MRKFSSGWQKGRRGSSSYTDVEWIAKTGRIGQLSDVERHVKSVDGRILGSAVAFFTGIVISSFFVLAYLFINPPTELRDVRALFKLQETD